MKNNRVCGKQCRIPCVLEDVFYSLRVQTLEYFIVAGVLQVLDMPLDLLVPTPAYLAAVDRIHEYVEDGRAGPQLPVPGGDVWSFK